jgi:parallel beta-helix repeat protein
MMKKVFFSAIWVLVLAIGFASIGFAQKGDEKQVRDLPSDFWGSNRSIQINRSGSYRLTNDIEVRDGNAVTITASNVTLDLNGYSVSTKAEGTGNGISIQNSKSVSVENGKVGGFNTNVAVVNSNNVRLRLLQITGEGLAPNNGPTEVGILLLNSRASFISDNTISSVNLGVFVRGGNSTGNRIFENTIIGGANPANNLLGICYNPAAGQGDAGPRGDNIYNNHIARFGFAIAISEGSIFNIFNENNLAGFIGGFRELNALTQNGGTNISEGNLEVLLPATVLP